MAVIRPFKALRPIPERSKDVASVPYDIVDTEEARFLAKDNPLSFLHVIRPEIDLPEGTDLYADTVYEQAERNFKKLVDSGVLIKDKTSRVYIYRIIAGKQVQTGIACCCSVDEYDSDIIKKHEYTRKQKEDDRLRHMLTLSAHPGPVLMTYRGVDSINSIVEREIKRAPLYDFVAEDGIGHIVWSMDDCEELIEAFKEVSYLYIADGHHRAAGASRVKKEMVRLHKSIRGDEEFNFFLSVLFPKEELRILPYNRWVCGLNSLSAGEFLGYVKDRFEVRESLKAEPLKKGYFCMYLKGKWYELHIKEGKEGKTDPVSSLDLSIYQKELLEPVLGIKDQKKDKRIDFIGGTDSIKKLERHVNETGGVAFSFFPVSIDELLAVADAGMIMPPKSTWFAPKLRSGLLIHQF